jgi:hypothetical protein
MMMGDNELERVWKETVVASKHTMHCFVSGFPCRQNRLVRLFGYQGALQAMLLLLM